MFMIFFFQAEDGIRDLVRSRGLGDVYKRQAHIITIIKQIEKKNYLGSLYFDKEVHGILHSDYQFTADDLLLVFGLKVNIDKFIEDCS